jgi:hypothetical protein
MDFLELKRQFESKLNKDFELLELHYSPFAFGSGMTAYNSNGQVIKIIYDGRDNLVEVLISTSRDKYPNVSWTTIYSGLPEDFIENGILNLSRSNGKTA